MYERGKPGTISPNAYLDTERYPRPEADQNAAWSDAVQGGLAAALEMEPYMEKANSLEMACRLFPTEAERLIKLADLVENGRYARNEMWTANLRLVDLYLDESTTEFNAGTIVSGDVRSLRSYVTEGLTLHPSLDIEDVRQWGREGLLQAIELFDPAKGAFSTIAFINVRTAVQRGFMYEGRTVRIKSVGGNGTPLSKLQSSAYMSRLEGGWSERYDALRSDPNYIHTDITRLDEQTEDLEDCTVQDDFSNAEWRARRPEIEELLSYVKVRSSLVLRLVWLTDNVPRTYTEVSRWLDSYPQAVRMQEIRARQQMELNAQRYGFALVD